MLIDRLAGPHYHDTSCVGQCFGDDIVVGFPSWDLLIPPYRPTLRHQCFCQCPYTRSVFTCIANKDINLTSPILTLTRRAEPWIHMHYTLIICYEWCFQAVLPDAHYQRSQGATTTMTLYPWRGAQSITQIPQ